MDSIDQGLRDVSAYVRAPGHQLDRDAGHVSREELLAARAASPTAAAVIDTIENDRRLYDTLRGATREGWFNDGQLTLEDLTALTTGSTPQAKSAVGSLRASRNALQARRAEFERQVVAVTQGQELYENFVFDVTLKMKKRELTLDLEKQLANEAKATYQHVTVDGRTFAQWQVGTTLSTKFDAMQAFFGDGSIGSYAVSVSNKQQTSEFGYRDTHGESHAVSAAVYNEALRRLRASGRTSTVETPDFRASYVVDKPLTAADIASVAPLQRRFVTLEIANHSFSLDLLDHARDATTQHRIEIEVPPTLQGGNAFRTGLNVPSILLGGRVSQMSGRVVSERTQTDASMVALHLNDGRTIVMTRDEASQRGLLR